jgi:hypothetical protein
LWKYKKKTLKSSNKKYQIYLQKKNFSYQVKIKKNLKPHVGFLFAPRCSKRLQVRFMRKAENIPKPSFKSQKYLRKFVNFKKTDKNEICRCEFIRWHEWSDVDFVLKKIMKKIHQKSGQQLYLCPRDV